MAAPLNPLSPIQGQPDALAKLEARVAKLEQIIALQSDGSVRIQPPSASKPMSFRAGTIEMKADSAVDLNAGLNFNIKAGAATEIRGGATCLISGGATCKISSGSMLTIVTSKGTQTF
jgi:hypothetical protein